MPERTSAIDRYGLSDEEYIEHLEQEIRDLEEVNDELRLDHEQEVQDLQYEIEYLRAETHDLEYELHEARARDF